MASSKSLPSSCSAHRTALLSGLFEIATVAGDATLLERRRHGPPRRAGKGTDTGGSPAGYAGCDRGGLKEEDRSQKDIDGEQYRTQRRVSDTFRRSDRGRTKVGNQGRDGDDHG